MKVLRLKFWAIWVAIVTVFCIGIAAFFTRGETLYDCSFQLASKTNVYKTGDAIVMTATVVPQKARSLTLDEDIHLNILIWNMQGVQRNRSNRAKPVRYEFSPESPLRFEIQGRIVVHEDGTPWVDFGKYGTGPIKDKTFPELRFAVRPSRVPLLDSAEWGASNSLQLTLE